MQTVFKILLASVCLLLVYDLFLLVINLGSKELMLQLLTVGGLLIAIPLLAGIMTALLEAALKPIKERQQYFCTYQVELQLPCCICAQVQKGSLFSFIDTDRFSEYHWIRGDRIQRAFIKAFECRSRSGRPGMAVRRGTGGEVLWLTV